MKKLFWCLGFASIFLLSACLNLKEQIQVNKDGSGTYRFLLDLSQFNAMTAMFGDMSDMQSDENFSMIDEKQEQLFKQLEDSIQGIHHIKPIMDSVNSLFGFEFQFDKVSDLNHALNLLFNEKGQPILFVELENNAFKRNYPTSISDQIVGQLSKEKLPEELQGFPFDFTTLLGNSTFTSEYIFEKNIKNVSNTKSLIGNQFKSVITTCPLFPSKDDSVICTNENIIQLQ